LVVLDCSYNELTSLDISKNSLLKILDCNGNKMPAIEKDKGIQTSDVEVYMDRSILEKRLKKIAQTKHSKTFIDGMSSCYLMSPPETVDYVCSLCGFTVENEYTKHQVFDIRQVEIIVKKILKLGFDVVFDKSEYCHRCSGSVIEKPEMIFSIRFSTQSDYHVVRSNLVNEYSCLLAFLENKETYRLERNNEECPLHENAAIIKHMTGLGDDLDLTYIQDDCSFRQWLRTKSRYTRPKK